MASVHQKQPPPKVMVSSLPVLILLLVSFLVLVGSVLALVLFCPHDVRLVNSASTNIGIDILLRMVFVRIILSRL
jgi:hypothetical protein